MNRIKQLRAENGYSQQKLADLMRVSRSTIAMWETGGSEPDNKALLQLADIFSVSTDYILGRAEDENENVGFMKSLKSLRLQHGYTQKELASKLHVAQNTLCNWENGNRTVDEPTLQKLADVFNVSVDYLLGRTDVKKADTSEDVSAEFLATLSPETQKVNELFNRLSEEKKTEALRFLDFLLQQDQAEKDSKQDK